MDDPKRLKDCKRSSIEDVLGALVNMAPPSIHEGPNGTAGSIQIRELDFAAGKHEIVVQLEDELRQRK